MMMSKRSMCDLYNMYFPVYDDEPDNDDSDDSDNDPAESKVGSTFTQDQVNTFLAKEKRKWLKEKESLVSQVEELTKNTSMSEQDRASWDAKIKQIRDESENKIIEQSKKIKKLQGQFETTVKEKDDEINKYKSLFINTSIKREISDAAIHHKAFNPRQIVDLLAPRAEYRPILDDEGKETGQYETWIKGVETKDEKTGKSVIIDMKAIDAIATLNESDPNLFKPNLVGGLQLNPSKGSGDGLPDMKNYQEYKEWREKNDLRRTK
jgi:hypothetical protein